MTARTVQAALSSTPGEPIGATLNGNSQHCTILLGEPGHGLLVTGTMDQLCDAIDLLKVRADELRAAELGPRHATHPIALPAHRGLRSDD